jgi:hypothetical protein
VYKKLSSSDKFSLQSITCESSQADEFLKGKQTSGEAKGVKKDFKGFYGTNRFLQESCIGSKNLQN